MLSTSVDYNSTKAKSYLTSQTARTIIIIYRLWRPCPTDSPVWNSTTRFSTPLNHLGLN